jgi:acyl carrier protein
VSLARARALLAEALAIGPETLPDDASLATVRAWDSLAHLRVILAIEAARGTPLAVAEALAITGLTDVARALDGAGP